MKKRTIDFSINEEIGIISGSADDISALIILLEKQGFVLDSDRKDDGVIIVPERYQDLSSHPWDCKCVYHR